MKKRRMQDKQPPPSAYVLDTMVKWSSELPRDYLVSQMGLPAQVEFEVSTFLDKTERVAWLGIEWPLASTCACLPEIQTEYWLQHVLHFRRKSDLDGDAQTREMVKAIRSDSHSWVGQFFGRQHPVNCFTNACGVLLAISFNRLPFEERMLFMDHAFSDMVWFSDYHDPYPRPNERAWYSKCRFVHRTLREVIHVAFCVLIHRAAGLRTHHALCDVAQFYDSAVKVCEEGEARPFRFYWGCFERLRAETQVTEHHSARLQRLVSYFAENEGEQGYKTGRIPLDWRLYRFQEPCVHIFS